MADSKSIPGVYVNSSSLPCCQCASSSKNDFSEARADFTVSEEYVLSVSSAETMALLVIMFL